MTKINKQEILPLRGENRNANRYNEFKINVTRLEREIEELDDKITTEMNKKDIRKTTEYVWFKKMKKGKLDNYVNEYNKNSFMNNVLNFKYGQSFNAWFSDRFRGRIEYVKKNIDIKYLVDNIYSKNITRNNVVFYPDSGFYFDKTFKTLSYYDNLSKKLTQKQIEKYTKKIDDIYKFCEAKKIKCYINALPTHFQVYYDIHNKFYSKEPPIFWIDVLNKNLEKNNIKPITSLYDKFLESKKNAPNFDNFYLYMSKSDIHYPPNGCFLVYNTLFDKIENDFKDVKRLSKKNLIFQEYDDFKSKGAGWGGTEFGNFLAHDLKMAKKFVKPIYPYIKFKNENDAIKIGTYDNITYYNNVPPNKKNILFIGDSFSRCISDWFSKNFQNVRGISDESLLPGVGRKTTIELSEIENAIENFEKDTKQKTDMLIIIVNGLNNSFIQYLEK